MKTPRIIQLVARVSVLAVLLAFSNPATASEKIKVAHWGHEKILIYAPLYIAMDGGFFTKEDLDIELVYSGNDDQVFATVLSGAAQFGVGDPAFTAISREKGGEGKVIAALVGRVANWAVTKNPDIQPFIDPKKLDGMRVTSFPSPSTTFTILSGLKKDHNLSKMEIKQLAFGTEQAALARDEADIAIMLEPQTSIAESQGFRVVWSLAKYYGDFALTGVTATDSFIKKDPELIQRFVSGLQAALTFCAKDPEAAAVIVEKSFPTLQPATVRSAMKRMVEDETIPRTAVINSKAWLKTLNLRKTVGDLKSLDGAEASLDSSFAEAAANGTQAEAAAVRPHPSPISHREARGWTYLARVADIIGIIASTAFIALVTLVLKERMAWNSLQDYDKDVGPIIRRCFRNKVASVREEDLVSALYKEKGRSEEAAKRTLSQFCKAGILKRTSFPDRTVYKPSLGMLTNIAILFELWDKEA